MNNNTSLQKPNDKIYKNPAIKFLLSLIESISGVGPVLAASRAAFEQKLSNIQEERRVIFFDELDKGGLITPEMLEKEEFIHSFLVVNRAAVNTYQREKIRRFARILLTAVEENDLAGDKFEEFTRILESISTRELYILSVLNSFEAANPHQIRRKQYHDGKDTIEGEEYLEDDVQRTTRYWLDFEKYIEKRLDIQSEVLSSILTGLNRTGLYETFSSILWDYGVGKGKITELFKQFAEWIKLESDEERRLSPDDKI
jgi:hypothetical protein